MECTDVLHSQVCIMLKSLVPIAQIVKTVLMSDDVCLSEVHFLSGVGSCHQQFLEMMLRI